MRARKTHTQRRPARTKAGSSTKAGARCRRIRPELLSIDGSSPTIAVADLERYMAAFLAERGRSGWNATAFLHGALELLDFSRFVRTLPAAPPSPAIRGGHAQFLSEVEGLAKTYLEGRRAQGLKPAKLVAEGRTLARFVRVARDVGLRRSELLPLPSTARDSQSTSVDGGKPRPPLKRLWHGTRNRGGVRGRGSK